MLYEQIARYYDLTHGSLTDDIGFVLHQAASAHGTILELGCGTGRLLRPLAQAGHTVVGLDNSPAMLTRGRANLDGIPRETAERITLIEADMTTFALGRQFGLILISYNTFMHFEPDAMARVLGRVADHLKPGGRLLLDLANPHVVAMTPNDAAITLEARFTDPESGNLVLQFATSHVELVSQRLTISWIYDEMSPAGGPVSRQIVDAVYYYRYPHQLEIDLSDSGLALTNLYGNYNKTPFHELSERMLLLAEKI